LAAAAGRGSAGLAAMVCGGAASARGAEVQNHTPAIATARTTLASIRPNALRIATLSKYATARTQERHGKNASYRDAPPSRRSINAKEVLTPHQHGGVLRRNLRPVRLCD